MLCYFVAFLAKEKLKHKTIKVYLSGVRFLHISEGFADPFQQTMNQLHYVLRGVKRCEAEDGRGIRTRLPISPTLLRDIKVVWNRSNDQDYVMLWAACCLAFFGFLRIGEMVAPSEAQYDPGANLCVDDVAVDQKESPTVIRVSIKQSKTDPFRRGVDLFLGKSGTDLCPVVAILNYLVVRGVTPGPLFLYRDGRFLTRQRFVVAVRGALQEAGIDQSKYCGHSFRIGAATTAASRGMEDSIIKTLGRWESQAYLQYVRIPREQLASYSRIMC